MNVNISKVAEVLNVHPRTIVRAVAGDVDAAFNKDTSDQVAITKLARAFRADPKVFINAIAGSDKLITQTEASQILRLSERTMRHHRNNDNYDFAPDVESGQTVRFSLNRIKELAKKRGRRS